MLLGDGWRAARPVTVGRSYACFRTGEAITPPGAARGHSGGFSEALVGQAEVNAWEQNDTGRRVPPGIPQLGCRPTEAG